MSEPTPDPRAAARPGRGDPRARRPTLLVVDDEPEVLHSVHDLLRLDYRVLTCERGAEAVERIASDEPIQVVMSDQRMPGMSGVEVLAHARRIRPEATRLLFTAYADIKAVIDAINEGSVFRYIAKPWDPDEFQSLVRQAVEQNELIVERDRLLRELTDSNQRLREANRLKSAFIEVASHELNTPVAVVLGLAQLWKLTQADKATQPLDLASTPLEPLVRAAAAEMAPFLLARGQEIALQLDPALGAADVDAAKVSDVLTNLIINAIKFTADGGTIRVSARPLGADLVSFEVADRGTGIAPEVRPYVFEPFFTGFDTMHHSSGEFEFCKRGIGLGLCLVKRFVELHGGRVDFVSEPGVGSTFTFTLPRHQPPAVQAGKP
jgi:signal transduction histidine kinase